MRLIRLLSISVATFAVVMGVQQLSLSTVSAAGLFSASK
jgi:hypothetical protein